MAAGAWLQAALANAHPPEAILKIPLMCFADATVQVGRQQRPSVAGIALTLLFALPAAAQEAVRAADSPPTRMEQAQREADRVFQVIRKSAPAPQKRPPTRPAPPQAARAPSASASRAVAKTAVPLPPQREAEQAPVAARDPKPLEAPVQMVAVPLAPTPSAARLPIEPRVDQAAAARKAEAAESAYLSRVLAYLESIKRYPSSREAREKRPSGTVRIWISVQRSGQLDEAGVEASSGSSILDHEALKSVRSGRYPPFPNDVFAGQPSRRFVVGMAYLLSTGQ